MKRKLFVIAVIALCLSLMAAGTLAYFTAEDTAHNVITSGGIDIELKEWADKDKTEPFPAHGVSGVMPGAEVTKIVEVENTGSGEAWVRVKVTKDIQLAEGVQGDVDNEPLAPGETTDPLFASVAFAPTMDNRYQNSTATVDVSAYAVQTANNGETVLEAKGWPEP